MFILTLQPFLRDLFAKTGRRSSISASSEGGAASTDPVEASSVCASTDSPRAKFDHDKLVSAGSFSVSARVDPVSASSHVPQLILLETILPGDSNYFCKFF